MLEQELQCTREVLESVKSQLSTSQALLQSCHFKEEQASGPRSTLKGDLIHTKMIFDNFKKRNQNLIKGNRALASQIEHLKEQARKSQKQMMQHIELVDKITIALQDLVSKAQAEAGETILVHVDALKSVIVTAMEPSFTAETNTVIVKLVIDKAKLEALEEEM
jgi:hypothetical protein